MNCEQRKNRYGLVVHYWIGYIGIFFTYTLYCSEVARLVEANLDTCLDTLLGPYMQTARASSRSITVELVCTLEDTNHFRPIGCINLGFS